jgi:ankyrin repeat protein
LNIVNALLARKEIQINQPMNNGFTALHIACAYDHVNIVNALLKRDGIEINKPTNDGTTPLIVASYVGNSSVVEALLSHAGIATTGTVDGKTAYDCSNANMRIATWSSYDGMINENGRKNCQSLLKLFDQKKK